MNNLELIRHVFETHPVTALFSILLIFLPIAGWMYIFTRQKAESFRVLALTFTAGIGSAVIMFFYQIFWEKELDFGFFELTPVNFQQNIGGWVTGQLASVSLIALSIGLIEEYLKHWVVKKSNQSFFRSVNDVIELSIVAALGFAFTENIIYLFREFLRSGLSGNFFSLFLLRSLFVVFVHVLCSGIYGYFYGVGFYAAPILETKEEDGRKERIPEFLHRLVHWKKHRVFQDEMITLGLLISTLVHGVFDFFMSVNWTLGSILGIEALNKVGIHVIILPLYLIGGFFYLWSILERKEHHIEFGKRMMKEIYVERDFSKNLEMLQKFEHSVEKNYQQKQKATTEHDFGRNIELLKKYEQTVEKKFQEKKVQNTEQDLNRNLELLEKYEDTVAKKYQKKVAQKETTPEEVLKNLEKMRKMEETIKKHYEKKNNS